MTPDDARKLIGGYATGSLTESERKILFDAALEDQSLFDELAREHELKELLEEPGARDRLIMALSPPPPQRRNWMPWIWTGAAVAAVAMAMVSWVSLRPSKPVETAQVREQTATPAPPPVATAQPAPAVRPEKKVEPEKKVAEPRKKVAEPANESPRSEAPGGKQTPAVASSGAVQLQIPAAPAPQQAQTGFLPQPSAAGGRGGRANPAARSLAMAPAKRRSFGFDYTVEPEALTLKFATDGWLSLHFAPGDDTIALAHVTAGQVRREPIPNNATEAAIVFAVEAQTDPTLGVNLTRSDKSGTVEDPTGNRIEFLLKFY